MFGQYRLETSPLATITECKDFFDSSVVKITDEHIRLPTETDVNDTDGCYASISVGNSDDKTTATADKQEIVLEKLQSILTCLPS